MNQLRKITAGFVLFSILLSAVGSFPLTANAWTGTWSFSETCNASGSIDVTATYEANDSLEGTIQYTSENLNLRSGDVVTVNLVEDNNQNSSYTVVNSNNCGSDLYCDQDGTLTYPEFSTAVSLGLISFNLVTSTSDGYAEFSIENNTNCIAPISLSVYKMYDSLLSTQTLFDGDGVVNVLGSKTLKAKVPECQAQIDVWYGQYPVTLLDTNPYSYPNLPAVISYGYANIGSPCTLAPNNTAPVITLIGSSTATTTVGFTFVDPGATAQDLEDGNITANIVATSTLDTNVVGSYTITYNVSDSQGLAATPVTRFVNVVPLVVPPTTSYCLDGVELTSDEFRSAVLNGLINYNLEINASSTLAIFTITNTTNCTAPVSLSSYKVFDTVLSHQEFFDGSGLVHATSTTILYADLPACMAQIDAWYGLHPEFLLDSDPYTHPNIPNVLAFKFIYNSGVGYWDANGNFCQKSQVNTPPVITLIGANPATINVGETYTDPGATAQDLEDGNITANIVATSTLNTNVVGSYTITYNVSDSQGLAATPVSRTVNVINPTPSDKGSIKFCLVIGDKDNNIATSSYGLPSGVFNIELATSTAFGTTTINSKIWNSSSFTPNTKTILTVDDSDCVTFSNLDSGYYYYSQLSVTGDLWNTPKYSDQRDQPVNSIFDLYPYSPELFNATTTDDELRNLNSDGHILLESNRKDRTVVLYAKYNPTPACTTNCGGGGGGSASANISVVKTSDVSTINVNGTINYTIVVTNTGPNEATAVSLTDIISSDLNFVSATSTTGSYATTTGIWTIGTLNNNASTTLNIVATVKAGTEGKTIANTAIATSSVNDPDSANNTSTVNVTVNNPVTNPPACTTNCGGGGGGGNGPIVGSFGGGGGSIVPPVVTAPNSCYYLYDYLRKDFNNNPVEVKKLQVFLRDLEGFSTVQVTGIYDEQTIVALDAFQDRYKDDILTPWGHTAPTSYTYILTKKKVNEIYCKMAFPVTPLQQQEIDSYRAFLQGLRDQGIYMPDGVGGSEENPVILPDTEGQVGVVPKDNSKASSTESILSTLAGVSSTTQRIAGDLTANVISAGKKLWDTIVYIISWPRGEKIDDKNECSVGCEEDSGVSGWINLILVLVIIVMAYLWYRQYQNNKKIEIINKEIDLQ